MPIIWALIGFCNKESASARRKSSPSCFFASLTWTTELSSFLVRISISRLFSYTCCQALMEFVVRCCLPLGFNILCGHLFWVDHQRKTVWYLRKKEIDRQWLNRAVGRQFVFCFRQLNLPDDICQVLVWLWLRLHCFNHHEHVRLIFAHEISGQRVTAAKLFYFDRKNLWSFFSLFLPKEFYGGWLEINDDYELIAQYYRALRSSQSHPRIASVFDCEGQVRGGFSHHQPDDHKKQWRTKPTFDLKVNTING